MRPNEYAMLLPLSYVVGLVIVISLADTLPDSASWPPYELIPVVLLWAFRSKDTFIDWYGRETIRFGLFLWFSVVVALTALSIAINYEFDTNLSFYETTALFELLGRSPTLGYVALAWVVVLFALAFVAPLQAARKAYRGEYWVYPLSGSTQRKEKLKGTNASA